MIWPDMAREQIPAQPPAIILESSFSDKFRDGMTKTQILCLDEAGGRIDPADCAHRCPDRIDLVEKRQPAGILILPMRVPMPVKAGEARGRQRLVNGRPVLDPGITLGNSTRIPCEARCKIIGQEACIGWAAPVVDKTDNRANPKTLELSQSRVAPYEICL